MDKRQVYYEDELGYRYYSFWEYINGCLEPDAAVMRFGLTVLVFIAVYGVGSIIVDLMGLLFGWLMP